MRVLEPDLAFDALVTWKTLNFKGFLVYILQQGVQIIVKIIKHGQGHWVVLVSGDIFLQRLFLNYYLAYVS